MAGTRIDCRFSNDSALASTSATVIASGPDGIVLGRIVFYARKAASDPVDEPSAPGALSLSRPNS
jgi:hypothetical protein